MLSCYFLKLYTKEGQTELLRRLENDLFDDTELLLIFYELPPGKQKQLIEKIVCFLSIIYSVVSVCAAENLSNTFRLRVSVSCVITRKFVVP